MDMTGQGWRCVQCGVRSEMAKAEGGSDMADHLTPGELQGVVNAGTTEAWGGAGLALGGVALSVLSAAAGGAILVVFTGMIAGGLGMLGHGLHRRSKAAQALRHFPAAKANPR
jgi:hypothetical protein